ncbi:uncharacterized protein LOC107271449 isoform X1 [Cephus cinctus]|uniref:Uncharacterized protein LOC107271449 isoform X1 n=1 Tax=Cephus cinctus TaxID=211228 RepID=A0AAJ7C6I1_CEPCN|nr:uncharacterized protein LOC107271449 isoform X1 [Cephus cinctus]
MHSGSNNFNPYYNQYAPTSAIYPTYNPNHGIPTHNMYNYMVNPSYSISQEEEVLTTTLAKRQNDEKVIENFIGEKVTETVYNNSSQEKSNIATIKTALISACKLNERLNKMASELKTDIDLPEEEWQTKLEECQSVKSELSELLNRFKEANVLEKTNKQLEKRKKKRLREKRRQAKWNLEKILKLERRAILHAEADAWISRKQEEINKEKQEEELRRDADMILSDVRGKRSDAKKFLAVLQELENLRKVKVNAARARGEHLSSAADEAFNNIIVKLVEQWAALDREYSIEEQGLKLMLKTDNEEKIEKQKRNTFDDWERVLFGRKLPSIDSFQRDPSELVAIRFAWDKYISYNGQGSPIPIGWVMPETASSAAWQKYLKNDSFHAKS